MFHIHINIHIISTINSILKALPYTRPKARGEILFTRFGNTSTINRKYGSIESSTQYPSATEV